MTFNKKKNILIFFIIICCVGSMIYSFINTNQKEIKNTTEFSEIEKKDSTEDFIKLQEEKKELIKNWNLSLSIVTDIYKSILDKELNLDTVYFNNKGITNIDNVDYYTISLTNEDEETLKVIGVDLINNNFVFIENNKTTPIQNYQYIGKFVDALNPWYLQENKIMNEENNQYERYGTIVYLYRENEVLKLSISTYNGFAEIAQIIVSPTLSSEDTLSFSFEDDNFGNSGSGTIKFVSNKELILDIKTNKTDFGLYSGKGTLYNATS